MLLALPGLEDFVTNILEYGQIWKGDGLFYSGLDGGHGYIQKTTQREGLAIDRVTNKRWPRAQIGNFKTLSMIDRFGRRLSQAFAETAQGEVYFFTRSGLDGTAFPATTVWGGWEYSALTKNPRVTRIIQVDPFKEGDLGHRIWTPDQCQSRNPPKSGNVAWNKVWGSEY
ncbi:hypothetical protein BDV41DRAFT_583894 [Aspergillus transmontanensis]|uniref:Uncharacterized protein n=1 Tax=Aspergillus transmontanensis TaxID=1034304 RepID=A0A5N6VIU7_9EURO|nr:hypothetical protein BDV41DRAFT_583894 [Aspergillus transmontanensis]